MRRKFRRPKRLVQLERPAMVPVRYTSRCWQVTFMGWLFISTFCIRTGPTLIDWLCGMIKAFLSFFIGLFILKRRMGDLYVVAVFGAALCLIAPGAEGFLVPGIILPLKQPETHPQLTNREQWLDHLSSNPLGKLYFLRRGMDEVGLDFEQFEWSAPPLVLDDIRY